MRKSNEVRNEVQSQYDLNRDGVVDQLDAETLAKIKEAELIDDRDKNLLHLAWLAMLAIVGVTLFLLTPWVSDSRVASLGSVLDLFYLANASVIGFYAGVKAFMSRNKFPGPQ